jgi:hypothetical protein
VTLVMLSGDFISGSHTRTPLFTGCFLDGGVVIDGFVRSHGVLRYRTWHVLYGSILLRAAFSTFSVPVERLVIRGRTWRVSRGVWCGSVSGCA